MYKNEKSDQQNRLKLLKNHLNTIFCVFINSSKKFHEHMRTENANYKIV